MDYRVLGPLEVVDDGQPVQIGSRLQRALLALLLLHHNRVVSTDRILEELWGDDPEGKERTLWVYISRLRSILEPDRRAHADSQVLVTRDRGYSLLADADEIDAARFEDLARRGNRLLKDDPEEAGRLLREALALWRGAALEDFAYDEFARADAARLEELRLVALEDRIDADVRSSRHREVIGELEKLVLDHPHRERFVALQMIALYRSGRQADALRAFERHRRVIGEELGIEPSPELRLVEEQMLLHDPRLAPDLERSAVGTPATVVNPFKGLQAFTEGDAANFFGRDRMVSDLVRRLANGSRLVALVGASGSGKSSVLRAGLVPALRKGAVDGSQEWLIASMVPGSRPFRELEAALLRSTLDAPDSLADLLDDPEDGILRACLRLLPDETGRVVIVIDQFEELFTLGASPADQERFVRNLEVVIDDAHQRVVVAIGLRADFYGQPLAYPRFAELLGEGIVNVVPLTPDELEAAAQRPAASAGAALEPSLVVQLLTDIAGQVGGLPLFQYTLTELFERREGSLLTLEAYHAMGGVSGALARRAEDLFLELDAASRDAAKQLFLRLVTIPEEGTWGRRRVAGSEIVTIAAEIIALQSVLNAFAEHRLLTFDRDLVSGSPTVEVAHEALLREWPRLRRWIDEGQQDVMRQRQLNAALTEWVASGEETDYLLSGQRLADYERWASASVLQLTTDEERFLDASILHREEQRLAEEQRQAREQKLDRQARNRLWGMGIGGALVAAAVTMGLVLLVAGDGKPAIALVHGVPGDLGVTDLMIAGAGLAEQEHDLEVDLTEVLVDPEDVLRDVAEAGADLVIAASAFDLEVGAVAPDYPDVHFVAIDPVALHTVAANISEVHFEVEDSAFLAGAAAAAETRTGKVGFIGGFQSFRSERSRNGFEQGASWAGSDAEVVATFLGPVENPVAEIEDRSDLAHELATAMFADGVDVIFHDAGRAGGGVIRAARDWSEAGGKVWTIGSDVDEYHTVPAEDRTVVLTSTVKRYDTAVALAISSFLDGSLEAGDTMLGIDAGGVALSRSGGYLAGIEGPLRNLEGDIEAGHLIVSPHARRPPVWQQPLDVTVRLSVTDSGCEIEGVSGGELDGDVLRVPRARSIAFELSNRSGGVAGLGVNSIEPGTTLDQLRDVALVTVPEWGVTHSLSQVEPGAATNGTARAAGTPIIPSCFLGNDPTFPSATYLPLIVRPT